MAYLVTAKVRSPRRSVYDDTPFIKRIVCKDQEEADYVRMKINEDEWCIEFPTVDYVMTAEEYLNKE